MLGDRYRGPMGALVCVVGIMAAPLTILVVAATAYDRVADHPLAQLALTGAAVSAAGLILGTSAKLLVRARPSPMAWVCAMAAMVAVAGFQRGLLPTLACLAPLGLASAAWSTRRQA